MQPSQSTDSQVRLKAEGFPTAPLIEAIMEIQFEGGLTADESKACADALGHHYATCSESKQTAFMYDVETTELNVDDLRAIYRLEGTDDTEISSIRTNGIAVSQLAPYRSWEKLFERLKRDLSVIDNVIGTRLAVRLGVRFINRIDVPLDDNRIAEHERYLAAHVRLPASIPSVMNFYFNVHIPVPEVAGVAIVQSGVLPPAIEGKASFSLDIDLSRTHDLAVERNILMTQLSEFQEPKNGLYRQLLTEKALEEFS